MNLHLELKDIIASLAILVTIIMTTTAQILSHLLTQKREDQKYIKECYQNLYSPIIFKAMDYIEKERAERHANNWYELSKEGSEGEVPIPEHLKKAKEDTLASLDTIMEILKSNIKYAHPKLLMSYETVRKLSPRNTGFRDEVDDLMFKVEAMLLCINFLSEYVQISQKIKSLSPDIMEQINLYSLRGRLYTFAVRCRFEELAYKSLYVTPSSEFSAEETKHLLEDIEKAEQAFIINEKKETELLISIRHRGVFDSPDINGLLKLNCYEQAFTFFEGIAEYISAWKGNDAKDSWLHNIEYDRKRHTFQSLARG